MASSVSEPRRPRIGLSTYLEVASWGVWSRPAAIVPQVYLDAVTGAGGQPVLLPPTPTDPSVPCYHHQGLGAIPSPLVATAWADDGLVEAVELAGADWVLGVQWHPEENPEDRRLFEALVSAARERSERQ